MKADIIYHKFLPIAKYLLKELDYYGENQFKKRVVENQWTVGEFYDYLLNSTLSFYIPEIQKCLNAKTGNGEGKKKAKGKFVFWYGRFPAIFKFQEISGYKPVQPESPDKVKDSFYRFIKIMAKTAQDIDNSSSQSKTEHPQFGMLNAIEWYRMIEMNFKFQLRTKHELDKIIRNVSFEDDDLPDMAAVREARSLNEFREVDNDDF